MFHSSALLFFALSAIVYGQQIGTLTAEVHPPLTWETCTASGCTSQDSTVVIDANWRYLHITSGTENCYEGDTWDFDICTTTYGVTTSGDALTLKFVTVSEQANVGSRLYLMAPGSETEYQLFHLLNQEFTFDVDVSQLPCGINGALYFSQMDADGGVSRFPTNKAGAQYGTGYCDSQCPSDIKFIDGVANTVDWTPSTNNVNTGTGSMGTCCTEMDIWEANSMAAAFTAHACTVTEQTSCTGTTCSLPNSTQGVCDQAGCDFNSFRLGDTSFFGPGMTVDTTQPFTVVTQFVTSNNESTGSLSAIRRIYVQNGVEIANSETNGGLDAMASAFNTGMVLVLTTSPTDGTAPGDARGACATTSGVPATVEAQSPNAQVIFSNIKVRLNFELESRVI
ncbi:glycoside hydrolase family 7 protein [Rhodocollybia butyracea]|uniref:Glucanase n=1 Tax=Rhodocollybia butyracea TaxID=206335 RepID=A0A9P5U7Z3_9AGAR|nr:glycoside hydrolase family 7 protein [Rhodocollybia butyracea]